MHRRMWSVVALIAAAAMAGCVGGDDAAPEPAEDVTPQDAEEVQVTETTGSISGTVASDLFEPLAGATVTVVENGENAIVARNGRFTFNGVEPGRYTIHAQAIGYHAGNRAVEVRPGEVSSADFVLKPLPSDDPWVDQREWAGILAQGAAWQVEPPAVGCQNVDLGDYPPAPDFNAQSCGHIRSGGSNGENALVTGDDTRTIMVEMLWSPAGPLGEHLVLELLCSDVPRGFSGQVQELDHACFFGSPNRPSPIVHRVDEEHWLEHGYNFTGDWAYRVFPGYGMLGTHALVGLDAGVAYQQSFRVFSSVFHKEKAPEGYTALPDA